MAFGSFFNRLKPGHTSDGSELRIRHTPLEDAYAFAIGCSMIVLGIVLLKTVGLVTGGVAGIALLVSYLVPLPVGVLFMLINVPFFVFAYLGMGRLFMIKTVIVSASIMALGVLMPLAVHIDYVQPLFAALFGGTIIGMGILSLARHGAGAGGTGVLCLYLQKTRGINAGKTQLVIDALIVGSSFFVLSGEQLLYSILSAAAMSGVMMSWHKPERYIGH
ncbi:YitT family protein [Asticcacaulis sp. YBE204]|uniref:YitT family protein n=1 Tax=Asticcacaulis sp. YBE204 TaxID=1282363 RepID=UPI0003C3CFBB|nr:YitT family protein [Asticcacaulis sp. YBE204]ESQ80547.1 membrane protein [Asticcacaulis sp. YBE204]